MKGGHSGLWPHFRPNVMTYPWRLDRLDELRDTIRRGGGGKPVCEPPTAEELGWIYQRLGVGTRPTFASLGRWSYWHEWRDKRQYSAPNGSCIAALKAWTPPRTDELVKGVRGRVVDLPSAYPSRFRMHPCGTSARITREPRQGQFWTWFAQCRVYVPHELALGPVKVGREFPRRVGEYTAWLWRELTDDCRLAGCDVEVLQGWAWEWFTTDNAPWVDRLLHARAEAPGGRDGTAGTILKMATNAAIGYQGIGNRYRRRVPAGTGEIPGIVAGRLAGWDWSEERTGRATMLHWQRYTEMLVARDLYRLALPYAERGELYRLWFDEMEVKAA